MVKTPSHIKNRRIPNHEPELFHAVFSHPKKTKQIPPLKFSKKNMVSTAKSNHHKFAIPSSAAPCRSSLGFAIFENPMGSPTKSQVSPFPRIVHIPFCQSWQFFSWNFRRNGCEGKGVFPKCVSFQVAGGTPNRNLKPWASQTQASPNSRL